MNDVTVLNRCMEILIGFTNGKIPKPNSGICKNMHYSLTDWDSMCVWEEFYLTVIPNWSSFSGSNIYPVPLPSRCSTEVFEDHEWFNILIKWDRETEYGKNRLLFVEYLIEQIELRLEELS